MKEEKEIYSLIISDIRNCVENNFEKDFRYHYENELKNDIDKNIKIFFDKKEIKFNNIINQNEKELKNITYLNVIILGNSGVGKSTLVNSILGLEKNKAKEQDSHEPMNIEGWIKRYPINEEDTKLKKINLWDTEGIFYSCKEANNQENHLQKVVNHIRKYKSNSNEQINCLWFCINGTTFQEKEYIERLMNAYNEKNKIHFCIYQSL